MRKYIIDAIIMGFMGVLLASMGYTYNTWQYWVIIIFILCYRFNGMTWEDLK